MRRSDQLFFGFFGAGLVAAAVSAGPTRVQINTDANGDNIRGDAANEPSFAFNPLDPSIMVVGWRQFPTINSNERFAGNATTFDGGRTWFNHDTLAPPPGAGAGANQSDPVLAADRFGSFFYNSLIFRSTRDGQTSYRSDDDGLSWGTPNYITKGFADKNWYAIDNTTAVGNHFCIWGNVDINFTRSFDRGVTWTNEQALGFGISSYVSVGPDGELFAGWWNHFEDQVEIRRSDNATNAGGVATFGPTTVLEFGEWPWLLPVNPAGGAGQLYVEVDHSDGPRRGWVYALSSAVRPGVDVCDVMFARSVDGGLTFSAPVRVNDDSDPDDYQWMAAMSVAPGGRIDAAWLDTRSDPNHLRSRLYYSYSYDGGVTWAENRPLSGAFDPTQGWPQQNKIGDYFQSHSFGEAVNIIYPATHNGEQDIFFIREFPIELTVLPLVAGSRGIAVIDEARPNDLAWLVGSLRGEGSTEIPGLALRVDLRNPQQLGGAQRTDATGSASWSLVVPPGSVGTEVWIQAVQFGNASNVENRVVGQ
ncbi:MAG: hypothetical protein ACF8PN_13495 [Phycisphaerales bacterium]